MVGVSRGGGYSSVTDGCLCSVSDGVFRPAVGVSRGRCVTWWVCHVVGVSRGRCDTWWVYHVVVGVVR